MRILGVMTGTSCDGLDAACIDVDGEGWESLWSESIPYPPALRKRVLAVQKPGVAFPLRVWRELNRDLGDWYGNALVKMIKGKKLRPQVIANHGQTVGHFPAAQGKGFTVQLGDATRVAQQTGLTVVSNFRGGDMAAGGQGAPLVPLFHRILALHLAEGMAGIAIHNLGGISNTTYVGASDKIIAFDTGPANVWIDAAVEKVTAGKKKFDRDGKMAAAGMPDMKAVEALLKHPFFKLPPPKSTGRDDFPAEYFFSRTKARGNDLVATATAVTARSIAQAYERFVLAKGLPLPAIFFCGGGAKNKTLLTWVGELLGDTVIRNLSDSGFDAQYTEAQAFAVFGFMSLIGQPLGGTWTGVKAFGPPGQITPGENWPEVVRALTEAMQG